MKEHFFVTWQNGQYDLSMFHNRKDTYCSRVFPMYARQLDQPVCYVESRSDASCRPLDQS